MISNSDLVNFLSNKQRSVNAKYFSKNDGLESSTSL